MRLSLRERQVALREAHLARDEALYRALPAGDFQKVKDWDEKGPTVIWEGDLVSPDLSRAYRIQVRYGWAYPYKRPDVFPVKPLIRNQRHQMPTGGMTDSPGALCLLPHNPDGWVVGMTCVDVLARAVAWFKAYESGTLDDEFAPPEIERFFPSEVRVEEPSVILVDSLLPATSSKRSGACLLIPTKSSKFAFLDSLDDRSSSEAVAELTRLLGLILPDESITTDGWHTGDWFDLDREPPMPVPRTSADLLTLLHRSGYSDEKLRVLARSAPKVVAVRYPTPVGFHWLIFQTKFTYPSSRAGFRAESFGMKVRAVNASHALKLYDTYHINAETIFRRVSGYEVEKLQNKGCLLLGCGSVGSRVGELLIKSGVGLLWLADKDELRAGNVSRHVLGLDYIGQNKAEGLKKFLHKRNPQARIGTHTTDIMYSPQKLTDMISETDVIVSCLGNDAAELYVSQATALGGKPVLFCRTYLRGRLGEIFISRPNGQAACFNCASLYLNAPDCPVPRPPELPYSELVGLDGDCGSAFIPAAAIDLDLTALHGARLALSLLSEENAATNYWLIRGREFDADEYATLQGGIREPFRQFSYSVPRSADCEFCRAS
jgi:ThiF family